MPTSLGVHVGFVPSTLVLAGAAALGTNVYTMPVGSVYVSQLAGNDTTGDGSLGNPYATVQKGVTQAASGGTVVLRTGGYRETVAQSNTAKSVTILPYSASGLGISEQAWIDGSRVISSWTNNGNSTWTAAYSLTLTRFTDLHAGTGAFRNYTDQVWVDNLPLNQIADASTPGVGQFSVNQTSHTITIGTDPTGHTVEVSDQRYGLISDGVITVKGIGFRKHSPDAMEWLNATITLRGSAGGSLLQDCWIQQSAMAAFNTDHADMTIRSCTIQDMGWTGLTGNTCDRLTVNKTLVRRFNQQGWSPEPACSGMKFTRCDQGTFTQNWVEDGGINSVYGIWLDVYCTRFTIAHNRVVGDVGASKLGTGIEVELSDGGFLSSVQNWSYVVGNKVTNCGAAGFMCLDSGWNRVYNNECTGSPVAIYLWQDNRWNSVGEYRTSAECPGKSIHNEICNNHTASGTGFDIQFLAYDNGGVLNFRGGDMIDRLGGMWFTTTSGSMTQWGQVGGSRSGGTVNTIAGLSTLSATYGGPLGAKLGTNYLGTTAPDPTVVADPLPSDVAAIMSLPTSTKVIGPNTLLLPAGAAA